MSLKSKYDEMNEFYQLLDTFINKYKTITDETRDQKNTVLNEVKQLYNNYFNAYKKITILKIQTKKIKKILSQTSLASILLN